MKRILMGTAFAFGVGVAAFSSSAQAACGWQGNQWVCSPSTTNYSMPSDQGYPQPSTGGSFPDVTGYKPPSTPSYPGPRPSGGAGH